MWILRTGPAHHVLCKKCRLRCGMDTDESNLSVLIGMPIAVGHDIEEVCPHDEWLQRRNCGSGNVTNNRIDSWNPFCHMQQPFHSCCRHWGGIVLMHGSWLGFTGRWYFTLSCSIRSNTIYGMTDIYTCKQTANTFNWPCGARSGSPQ